jgi:ferritin
LHAVTGITGKADDDRVTDLSCEDTAGVGGAGSVRRGHEAKAQCTVIEWRQRVLPFPIILIVLDAPGRADAPKPAPRDRVRSVGEATCLAGPDGISYTLDVHLNPHTELHMPAKNIVKAINDQISMEFGAAHVYLSMSAYLDSENLPGFAAWMRSQYQEELTHALRLFDFVLEVGEKVELQEVGKPPATYKGPLDVMKKALAHERKVTASITKLYEIAQKEKHYTALLMLQWFISEQLEEEKTVGDLIAQLELIGDNGPALLMMDRELGSRGSGGEEA